MKKTSLKTTQRARRKKRIRSKLFGTATMPRVSVFKSNRYVSAQIINDETGTTLVAGTTKTMKGKTLQERATALGESLAQQAQKAGITKVVFDRGGYIYTGTVAALADALRAGGLTF